MTRFPIILSAPSGGGKTTIARALLRRRSDVGYSVSCTTRPPRPGEKDGSDYRFISRDEFAVLRERGDFAESAEVHGHLYGTLRSEIARVLDSGRHVVMDIDVQGARQLQQAYPDAVLIFLLPPDAEVLLRRLESRGTEDTDSLARRVRSAISELKSVDIYGYLVVNEELDEAVDRVSRIVDAEESRLARVAGHRERIGAMVADLEARLKAMNRS